MDRLDTMRAFVAVATFGSFAEAARHLRQSTSAVSRGVADLEERVGIVLFNRTTRSVRLTERGHIYLESCRQILDDLDGADRRVRGEGAEPRGGLTVAAPLTFGRLHVLPVVTRLLENHAALSVRLMLSDRNAHLTDEGIDVAVRVGDLVDSSLMAIRLGAVSRVLVASPQYLAARGAPQSPLDLRRHDIIAFEGGDLTNEWRFGATGRAVRIEPRLTVTSADAAIAAAEAGLGIARALSYQVRDSVLGGRLSLLLQDELTEKLPVSAIYPARRVASANLAAFIKTERDHFHAHPVEPASQWSEAST